LGKATKVEGDMPSQTIKKKNKKGKGTWQQDSGKRVGAELKKGAYKKAPKE